jgi:hypothetical protein
MPRPPGEKPRAQLAAKPPREPRAKKQKAALSEPGDSDRQGDTFLRLLVEHVSYPQFVHLKDPPLTMVTFLQLRNIALNDRFIGRTDQEVLDRTGNTPENLKRLRSHPHMPAVMAAIEATALELAGIATIDGWAEHSERQVGAELVATALSEPKSRERLQALEQLADRRSAKKGREDDAPRAPMFPASVERFMVYALEKMAAQKALPAGETDGGTLNVPKQVKQLPDPDAN